MPRVPKGDDPDIVPSRATGEERRGRQFVTLRQGGCRIGFWVQACVVRFPGLQRHLRFWLVKHGGKLDAETWHDVSGWGEMLEEQEVIWYVNKKDFGSGPFRWAIYQDGELMVASESFFMPTSTHQIVRVTVSLTDE